jgi:hypothetical protein
MSERLEAAPAGTPPGSFSDREPRIAPRIPRFAWANWVNPLVTVSSRTLRNALRCIWQNLAKLPLCFPASAQHRET